MSSSKVMTARVKVVEQDQLDKANNEKSKSSCENIHINGTMEGSVEKLPVGAFENGDGDDTVDKELEDRLEDLNKASSGEDAETKRKSATLTPSSSSDKHSSGFSQGNGLKGTSHAFSSLTRNNLRRSFTLPRSLLARKSGQTGPVSENQNGSFMKNIFLTLTRTKSVRKPKTEGKETKDDANSVISSSTTDQGRQCNGLSLVPGYTPAAVGLKNQGNTCFMNAIVQCLSHTDCLAKYLVMDGYKTDLRRKHWIKNGKCEVTEELAALLKHAWLRQNPTILEDSVTRFKAAIEKRASQWRGSEQHDAQEFFLWLLDRLHEDLNQAASSKYKPMKSNFGRSDEQVAAEALANHLRCNNSIIQEIFGAHFRSSLTCPGCGRQSATFDPFVCVSLPIPQAKQEVPVFVNIVYLAQQPRQVKLGLSVVSNADIKELKQTLSADTGVEEGNILLAEIDGEGFHRTFTETQLVSSLSNNDALYCIETPQIRETNENDGAFLMITWTNILVTNDGNTRVRFGSPYITQVARETGYVDLQKIFLKEMAVILQTDVLVSEQKDPVFSIRILDGSTEGSLVDPLVEHPLYMESVDHALSLCDEDVPQHIKVHLEWTPDAKDKIIINDAETVEEHESVVQTRLRHAEEPIASVTLGECFDLYTTAEQLSAEDSWHCPHCNRKEQGTLKMIGLWTAPQVLVVHLKRFRQVAKARTSATKISSVVDFPIDGLDLGPHVMRRNRAVDNNAVNSGLNQASSPVNGCFGISNWKNRASFKNKLTSAVTNNRLNSNSANGFGPSPDEIVYDLYAVCNHHGKDVLGGHYTAYCKNPVDGSWWSFDDTRVSKLSSPSDVKTASAYILFYHQRGSPSSQQSAQHWCRNLLKKHKLVNKIEVNGSETPPRENDNINGDCVVNSVMTNGHLETPKSDSDGEKELDDKYQNDNGAQPSEASTTSSTSLPNGDHAPLAIMEEVSMGLSPYLKEVQTCESTV